MQMLFSCMYCKLMYSVKTGLICLRSNKGMFLNMSTSRIPLYCRYEKYN